LQAARAELQNQDAGIHANLEAKESTLEEMKTKLLENEELIAKSQQELYEIKNAISIKRKYRIGPSCKWLDTSGTQAKRFSGNSAIADEENGFDRRD